MSYVDTARLLQVGITPSTRRDHGAEVNRLQHKAAIWCSAVILACSVNTASLKAQDTSQNTAEPGSYQRPVSWKQLPGNVLDDQKHIWEFPAKLRRKRVWIPTVVLLGVTAGLIATDHQTAPYFRHNDSFHTFNNVLSSIATASTTAAVPLGLYGAGALFKDSRLKQTALLAGEAAADTEILATVLKETTRRRRPADIQPGESYADSFYEGGGTSFPSGHSIVAFSIATVVARKYHDHKWVPFAAYGTAALIGFSRVSTSAHFVSDVFLGSALGYSIGRFTVLRQ